ncbi:FHA domain-containing protein [Candidatus Woesearchaeota archaeon]|nr:MAG: FHA domain-containing protein [Candidatus Woesearchaeota archaeon]
MTKILPVIQFKGLRAKNMPLIVPIKRRKDSLDFPMITMGRTLQADITFDHPLVSRVHAYVLDDSENREILQDANSKNGTFLNGERIKSLEKRVLTSGDSISLGGREGIRLRYFNNTSFTDYLRVSNKLSPNS